MTISPMKDGGLRIDIEDAGDWVLLGGITADAMSREDKLSHRLGEFITDEEVVMDWLEFMVPELEDVFNAAVLHVTTVVATARVESPGGGGHLVIARKDRFHWYSALNQARLALEETYQFGASERIDPDALPARRREPFLRTRFYCEIQSLLLDMGL